MADRTQWRGKGEAGLPPGGEMLVIVALNGENDRPDISTIKAFRVPVTIGVSYTKGIWREFRLLSSSSEGSRLTSDTDHPSLVLDQSVDFACIESQISTGIPEPDARDCELIQMDGPEVLVIVPL